MNKIFAKFMALAVSAAMIIPSVAIANEERFQGRRLTVSESRRYFVGDAATIPFD